MEGGGNPLRLRRFPLHSQALAIERGAGDWGGNSAANDAPLRPPTLMGKAAASPPRDTYKQLVEDGGDPLRLRCFSLQSHALAIERGVGDWEGIPRLLRAALPASPNGEGGDLFAEVRFHGISAQLMERGGDVRCLRYLCPDTSMGTFQSRVFSPEPYLMEFVLTVVFDSISMGRVVRDSCDP